MRSFTFIRFPAPKPLQSSTSSLQIYNTPFVLTRLCDNMWLGCSVETGKALSIVDHFLASLLLGTLKALNIKSEAVTEAFLTNFPLFNLLST